MTPEEQPLVSVIIPCYNYGGYLGEALRTVLAQEYGAWECIVVNDGSTDDTERTALDMAARDARFRYVYQPNKGLPAARNTGILQSRGAFLQFLDADDGLHPQKLRLQVAYLEQHREADLVYGDAVYFHQDRPGIYTDSKQGSRVKHRALQKDACGRDLLESLCINNIMEVSSPLIRRGLVERTGLFDPAYTSFEDWQYWGRCAAEGACFHYRPVPGTETWIRYGHASMMTHRKRMNENGIRLRHFMMPLLPPAWQWYNRYRLLKLRAKKIWLSLQAE